MVRKNLNFCPYCGGPFELKNFEGRERLFCSSCQEVYYQNPLPAATALVLNQENMLLLGRRAIEPAKGAWCLPGGFMEMGETMQQAALRELKEETGLEGKMVSFVGCFYQESRSYGSVIIFGYRVDAVNGELTAGDDMEAVQYYHLDSMPPVAFDSHRKLIAKLREQLGNKE